MAPYIAKKTQLLFAVVVHLQISLSVMEAIIEEKLEKNRLYSELKKKACIPGAAVKEQHHLRSATDSMKLYKRK